MLLCILNISLNVYIIIGLKIKILFYSIYSNLYCIYYSNYNQIRFKKHSNLCYLKNHWNQHSILDI